LDTFTALYLLILIIILSAGAVDIYRNREDYKTWQSFVWIFLLALIPIGVLIFYTP
jgi:maltodextrin utilization protein YvdJ